MNQTTFPGMKLDALLRPADIRRIVSEKLVGFRDRQTVRDAIRQKKRKRKKRVETLQAHFGEEYFTKSPVVFRASFEGPRGSLNPAGFRVPGKIVVELYHNAIGPPAEWRARRPGTRQQFPVTPQSHVATLQGQLEGIYFERRVSEWEAWDTSNGPLTENSVYELGAERLQADEWKMDKDGKVFLTEARMERVKARAVLQKAERKRRGEL